VSHPSPAAFFNLSGKVAVVTGGGSGIGRAIAMRFASAGATVRILDLNFPEAGQTAHEIRESGGNAAAFSCDVTDQAAVHAVFDKIFQKDRVHILVNNAGVSHIGNVESTTESDFDRIMRVNVKGYYNCIHACAGHMKA